MANPWEHAKMCVKKWGGIPEDYYEINRLMDETKGSFADNRHRFYWHNSYAVNRVIPLIFGPVIKNSDGKEISTKDVAEFHVLADFKMKFIPSLQDWLENMEMKMWMNGGMGGDTPSSCKKLPGIASQNEVVSENKPKELVD